jgi:hypothetical protein
MGKQRCRRKEQKWFQAKVEMGKNGRGRASPVHSGDPLILYFIIYQF